MITMKNFFILLLTLSSLIPLQAQSLEESGSTSDPGFTRGSRIIFQDNFEKDALDDFPAMWTTTLSGEVKKLRGMESKYLMKRSEKHWSK